MGAAGLTAMTFILYYVCSTALCRVVIQLYELFSKIDLPHVVSFAFLFPRGLGRCGFIMHPHFTPQVVSSDLPLFEVLNDGLASFL